MRNFQVTGGLAGKAAKLWLGTIVDSDTVYINGVMVGHTDYQYPPRKYEIPEGLLREGENTIVIRVKCENGHGRFTDGKNMLSGMTRRRLILQGNGTMRSGRPANR